MSTNIKYLNEISNQEKSAKCLIGYHNYILGIGDGMLVRIPKDRVIWARIRDSYPLLQIVKLRLGSIVPSYKLILADAGGKLPGFLFYRKIPGKSILDYSRREAPNELGMRTLGILAALHSIRLPRAYYKSHTIKSISKNQMILYLQKYARFKNTIKLLPADMRQKSDLYWNKLINSIKCKHYVSIIHGDLDMRNILIDSKGKVSGVLDWDNIALGDPARDLCGLLEVYKYKQFNKIMAFYFNMMKIGSESSKRKLLDRIFFYGIMNRFYELEFLSGGRNSKNLQILIKRLDEDLKLAANVKI